MHKTHLEGGVGPFEVTSVQANEISRRIKSEVPGVPGIPRTIVIEEGRRLHDLVKLSVEPLVGNVESDMPVLPDEICRQIEGIVEQVRMAA